MFLLIYLFNSQSKKIFIVETKLLQMRHKLTKMKLFDSATVFVPCLGFQRFDHSLYVERIAKVHNMHQ